MGEIRQRSSNGGPAQTVRLIGCSLFGKCFLVELPFHEMQPILSSAKQIDRLLHCAIAMSDQQFRTSKSTSLAVRLAPSPGFRSSQCSQRRKNILPQDARIIGG